MNNILCYFRAMFFFFFFGVLCTAHFMQIMILQSLCVLLMIFPSLRAKKFGSKKTGRAAGGGEFALAGTASEVKEVDPPLLLLFLLLFLRR